MRKMLNLTTTQGHVICIIVALMVGLPLWLIYKLSPDAFIFVLAWVIVRPIFKIWKEWDL